jgi:hypothetical protein
VPSAIDGLPGERLRAEAALVGEDFGLGTCVAIRTAKRRHPNFSCGTVLLTVGAVVGAAQLFYAGLIREVYLIGCGCMVVLGVVLMARFPTVTWDRVFRYQDGLAQIAGSDPEPVAVRWEDVATVSLTFASEEDDRDITSCTIGGRLGSSVTVDRGYGLEVLGELATEAERALAVRLLPELIEEYDCGRPVVFGDLRIDRHGITHASTETWYLPWAHISRVTDDGPGRAIEIRPTRESGRARKRIDLDGCLNGVLARHLIERAGVPVTHRARFPRPAVPPGLSDRP